jgi:hypothetical protein
LSSAAALAPKIPELIAPRTLFQVQAKPLTTISAWSANRFSISSVSSVPSIAQPLGVRCISSSQPCRSIDDFFISQPQADKDGKIMFPAVGEHFLCDSFKVLFLSKLIIFFQVVLGLLLS